MLGYYVWLLFCIVRLNVNAIANVRASTFVIVSSIGSPGSARVRGRTWAWQILTLSPHSTPSLRKIDERSQFEGEILYLSD